MKRLSFLLLLLLPGLLVAQELTQTDVTTLKNFDAKKATVFGFRLGMSREEALEVVKKNPKLLAKEEDWHSDSSFRMYINHVEVEGSGNNILYLIWDHGQRKTLNRICVFHSIVKFLPAGTKTLFTTDVLDSTSAVRKNFLGTPDSSAVTFDMPLIAARHVSYYYFSKNIYITDKQLGDMLPGRKVDTATMKVTERTFSLMITDGTGK